MNDEKNRCRYCGSEIAVGRRFCSSCIRDGFDNVFAIYGITNGWDKKPKAAKPKIENGWRGMKVVGAFTSNCKSRY